MKTMKSDKYFRYCSAFLMALCLLFAASVSAADNSEFSPKIGPFVRKAIRNASLMRQAASLMKIIIVTDTPYLEIFRMLISAF
ncbi:MAG: hypothetical protein HC887_08015 [Desulfobacteraceae bacterium]|nr:hypothetical protein [Desulfobacteraceae bacterium]